MKRTVPINRQGLTIIEKLGGVYKLDLMLGLKNVKFIEYGIQFEIRYKSKANFVRIVINENELYTLEFGNIKHSGYLQKSVCENIQPEKLKPLFETKTGLLLSL